jgi:hypothetical protein
MSLPPLAEYENGGPTSKGPPLDSSFPRTRKSRFVPHRISLVTRFRGYDVTQVASADRTGTYFLRIGLPALGRARPLGSNVPK